MIISPDDWPSVLLPACPQTPSSIDPTSFKTVLLLGLSRNYSSVNIVTRPKGWTFEKSGFDSRRGWSSSLHRLQNTCSDHAASWQMGPGAFPPKMKGSLRESAHSFEFSVEAENVWRCTLTYPQVFTALGLPKIRDNVTKFSFDWTMNFLHFWYLTFTAIFTKAYLSSPQ
jgi:hypothetical protein